MARRVWCLEEPREWPDMEKCWRKGQARSTRGGHSRGREWPLMVRERREEDRGVVGAHTAAGRRDWRVTGPEGKMMGAAPSYRFLKEGGSREREEKGGREAASS